jgi:hypothetical protein
MAKQRHHRARPLATCGPAPPVVQHADEADLGSASLAKRRPHSGQELRDDVRSDPSKEVDPRPKYPWSDRVQSSDLRPSVSLCRGVADGRGAVRSPTRR